MNICISYIKMIIRKSSTWCLLPGDYSYNSYEFIINHLHYIRFCVFCIAFLPCHIREKTLIIPVLVKKTNLMNLALSTSEIHLNASHIKWSLYMCAACPKKDLNNDFWWIKCFVLCGYNCQKDWHRPIVHLYPLWQELATLLQVITMEYQLGIIF